MSKEPPAIRKARAAMDQAWSAANQAATDYESLRPEDYDTPQAVAARERMLRLADYASRLQDEFNALPGSPETNNPN